LLAFPPRDAEAARVRCRMLVHESDGLESDCILLGAEVEELARREHVTRSGEGLAEDEGNREGRREGIRQLRVDGGEDRQGEGEPEGEEVECSGLLEKLRAHDGRRKLVMEMRELEEVRREVEEWVGRVLERRFAASGVERRGDVLAVGVV